MPRQLRLVAFGHEAHDAGERLPRLVRGASRLGDLCDLAPALPSLGASHGDPMARAQLAEDPLRLQPRPRRQRPVRRRVDAQRPHGRARNGEPRAVRQLHLRRAGTRTSCAIVGCFGRYARAGPAPVQSQGSHPPRRRRRRWRRLACLLATTHCATRDRHLDDLATCASCKQECGWQRRRAERPTPVAALRGLSVADS